MLLIKKACIKMTRIVDISFKGKKMATRKCRI